MKFKNTLIIGLATLTLISCNDFLDVDSPSSYNEDFVFSQETEISRALNGVYASILVGDLYGTAYQKTFNLNSDVDMQMYTGNFISNKKRNVAGKNGHIYSERDGVCFEPQYYPDAINHSNFVSPVCRAGEKFDKRIRYIFR